MKKWFLTGPTKSDISRFKNYENCGFVILGDAELLNRKVVKKIDKKNTYYCVRGLDEKPKYLENLKSQYDEDIHGMVWLDPKYPYIKFLEDGEIYTFGNAKTLVLGGGTDLNADAELLKRNQYLTLDTSLSEPEQLLKRLKGREIDVVLTYTAKIKELKGETEEWIDKILRVTKWKYWIIGRFKEDVNISDRIMYINEDIINFDNFSSQN